MTTARRCAYETLLQVETQKAYVNLALKDQFRKNPLDARDKGLCSEIVYGTVQRQRTLDALLSLVCTWPLQDLQPEILTILRMSVYQLEFLDKVPAYAVFNEAVELAKARRPQAAGFVNGALRGYQRDKRSWREKILQPEKASAAEQLGLALSYPTWMTRRLIAVFGLERAERILEASNRKSRFTVRVNMRYSHRDEILRRISEGEELPAEPSPLSPEGISILNGVDVERWPLYREGAVSVQDEGAMLIAPLAKAQGVPESAKILDMCAAPGGKATHLAELFPEGRILAVDIHAHKVALIQEAARRLHLENIQTMTADARMLPQFSQYREAFDAVLLDAPCSGLGVLRHRPDIRWRKTERDVTRLAALQKELLQTAVKLVKPGGVIVYSTCTLLPEENQRVVEDVLRNSAETLAAEALASELPAAMGDFESGHGVTLTPELFDTDGFYMCRLRKRLGLESQGRKS